MVKCLQISIENIICLLYKLLNSKMQKKFDKSDKTKMNLINQIKPKWLLNLIMKLFVYISS